MSADDPMRGDGGPRGGARPETAATVEALLSEGLACYRRGDTEGARARWQRATKLDPRDVRAAEYLAHLENTDALAAPSHAGLDDEFTLAPPQARAPAVSEAREELTAERWPGVAFAGDVGVAEPMQRDEIDLGFEVEGWADAVTGDVDLELSLSEDDRPGRVAEAGGEGRAAGRAHDEADDLSPIDELRARWLAELARSARGEDDPGEAIARRIGGLLSIARRELEAGRGLEAAVAAELATRERPDSAAAQKLLHEHASTLLKAFAQVLGDARRVPMIALPMHELPGLDLDSRTAFLLSRIDGVLSMEEILDVSGMPRLEACSYLTRLVLQGVLEVR